MIAARTVRSDGPYSPISMSALRDLTQQQVADLLHGAADAITAWAPPADESPALLRPVPPGYILTWAGVQYALPGLVGLRYLATLMEQSPTAIHCADLVDPTGQAKASLGQVYETEIDAKAARAARRAMAGASDDDRAALKTYVGSAHKRGVAGAERLRDLAGKNIRVAMRLIAGCCPGAQAYIRGKLTTGIFCRYGAPRR